MNDFHHKIITKKQWTKLLVSKAEKKEFKYFLWFGLIQSKDIHDILFHSKVKLTIHTFLLFSPSSSLSVCHLNQLKTVINC